VLGVYFFKLLVLTTLHIPFKHQAQTKEVKTFWQNVDLEKKEMDVNVTMRQKELSIKQKEMEIKLATVCDIVT
jgi:hypothetical protein